MQDHAQPTALARVRLGPLAGIVDRVIADMEVRGHATRTIKEYVSHLDRLGRWMVRGRCLVTALDESTLHGYLEGLTASVRRRARAATRRLLSTLRTSGVIVGLASAPRTPVQDVVRRFLAVYARARGVRDSTCRQYGRHVGQFLAFRCPSPNDIPDLTTLTAGDVRAFIAWRAGQGKPGAAKSATTAVRAFLRYLVQEGHCLPDLIGAVPTVARRHNPVPRALSDTQVRALLTAFNRSCATGRRDFAIALCLWQLALRVGEVVALQLDDVDWRAGTVRITTSKSRRAARLPLPREVGRAIAEYLRHGRPRTTDRHVFVTHALPIGRPLASEAARQTIRRAFQRAQLASPSTGTHTLRHTAATSMACRGASLKEVADVLRHRHLDTTMVYARVDLPTLRSVALPWPEVQ